MYSQKALLAYYQKHLAIHLNTSRCWPGIEMVERALPDDTKATRENADRLVAQGKLNYHFRGNYSLVISPEAKRALALEALQQDYDQLRAYRNKALESWQSWQLFKKYAENVQISCEPGLTERDRESYGWLCYTGELGGKRQYISPITDKLNAENYDRDLLALDRLIVCVENNLPLSLA